MIGVGRKTEMAERSVSPTWDKVQTKNRKGEQAPDSTDPEAAFAVMHTPCFVAAEIGPSTVAIRFGTRQKDWGS